MIEFEEKNNDVERIISNLKNQFQEALKAEYNLEKQLKEREKELEKLEDPLIFLRNKKNE